MLLWIKRIEMVKIKHKEFIDALPFIPCQDSSWDNGLILKLLAMSRSIT